MTILISGAMLPDGSTTDLLIDKGVIAERGTHPQLLERGGLYAGLWNRQREADEAREKLKLSEEREAAIVYREPAAE